jgi:hypothetical protein
MFDRILQRMRDKVRSSQYVMTLHAEEEMEEDDLSIFDIESCVLVGEIIERQKDVDSGEWKYVINGKTLAGDTICVISKLGITGILVFITVFRE